MKILLDKTSPVHLKKCIVLSEQRKHVSGEFVALFHLLLARKIENIIVLAINMEKGKLATTIALEVILK